MWKRTKVGRLVPDAKVPSTTSVAHAIAETGLRLWKAGWLHGCMEVVEFGCGIASPLRAYPSGSTRIRKRVVELCHGAGMSNAAACLRLGPPTGLAHDHHPARQPRTRRRASTISASRIRDPGTAAGPANAQGSPHGPSPSKAPSSRALPPTKGTLHPPQSTPKEPAPSRALPAQLLPLPQGSHAIVLWDVENVLPFQPLSTVPVQLSRITGFLHRSGASSVDVLTALNPNNMRKARATGLAALLEGSGAQVLQASQFNDAADVVLISAAYTLIHQVMCNEKSDGQQAAGGVGDTLRHQRHGTSRAAGHKPGEEDGAVLPPQQQQQQGRHEHQGKHQGQQVQQQGRQQEQQQQQQQEPGGIVQSRQAAQQGPGDGGSSSSSSQPGDQEVTQGVGPLLGCGLRGQRGTLRVQDLVLVCITQDTGFAPLLSYATGLGCYTVAVAPFNRSLKFSSAATLPPHLHMARNPLAAASCAAVKWLPDPATLTPTEQQLLTNEQRLLPVERRLLPTEQQLLGAGGQAGTAAGAGAKRVGGEGYVAAGMGRGRVGGVGADLLSRGMAPGSLRDTWINPTRRQGQ